MHQLWTIIFISLLVIGFSLAAWLDRDESQSQARPGETHKQGKQIKH